MGALGFDLGTESFRAARLNSGVATEIIPTPEGGRIVPASVFVSGRGDVLTGRAASVSGSLRPADLFTAWKLQLAEAHGPKKHHGRPVSPTVLTSYVLRRLISNVRHHCGEDTKEAVLVVPATFGDLERGATIDAARIAGIDRPHLLNEPTAAALAFGLGVGRSTSPQRVLVYSLGAGCFGVALVSVSGAKASVIAASGERLGGRDWDDEIANLAAEQVYERTGIDPREEELSHAQLREAARKAKHSLTLAREAVVAVPVPFQRRTENVTVTRAEFEERTQRLLDRTEAQLLQLSEKTNQKLDEVDAVVVTGGATRMPAVQELVRRMTMRVPAELDPEETIVRGAALYAGFFSGKLIVDVEQGAFARSERRAKSATPTTARPRPRPSRSAASERFAKFERSESEESEEIVAFLPGAVGNSPVQDVVAHGLGVLVTGKAGSRNSILIPSQSPIPVERKKEFVTVKRGQTAVMVKVLEGEDPDVDRCTVIGMLKVEGLPEGRPKGQKIEVSYRYDGDGRVQVSAVDVGSGLSAKATIERRGALDESEIRELRSVVASST